MLCILALASPLVSGLPVEAVPLPDAAVLAAGGAHSCVVIDGGGVHCWGDNQSGQLGAQESEQNPAPLSVLSPDGSALADVLSIDGGGHHSCASVEAGTVWCWGGNSSGQLGDATTTGGATPVAVRIEDGPLGEVTQVSAGGFHTCAISAGTPHCWGGNFFGQLGDDTTSSRSTGAPVLAADGAPLRGVKQIVAGAFHTCVITSNTGVSCWGANFFGQLGGDGGSSTAPMPVRKADGSPLSGVKQLTVGDHHTCALQAAGRIACWGRNDSGQLGDGGTTGSAVPVTVEDADGDALGTVRGIAGGGEHTCAVLSSGGVRCWGAGAHGRLGDGGTTDRSRPVAVVGIDGADDLRGVKAVAAGDRHTCALLVSRRVHCWGDNRAGQLVGSDMASSPAPVIVPYELVEVRNVALGRDHTCALLRSNHVRCWGDNTFGQLGDGTTGQRRLPQPVGDVEGEGALTAVRQLVAGRHHTCALTTTSRVRCWGANFFGQLGDGSTTPASRPRPVTTANGAELSGVKQLSAGAFHTCALLTTGRVECWGANFSGQLGDGTTRNRPGSAAVGQSDDAVLSGAVEIAAGGFHSCARLNSGGVRCWGSNLFGQLGGEGGEDGRVGGSGGDVGPVVVAALTGRGDLDDARQIAAGEFHTCVVVETGRVGCWGANFSGQLGDGTTERRSTPVTVRTTALAQGSPSETRVTAGGAHACVIVGDRLGCWGDNSLGQLGDGSAVSRPTPVAVIDVDGGGEPAAVKEATVGGRHTCAVHGDGRMTCWGANDAGQLGDGTVVDRPTPVRVATTG